MENLDVKVRYKPQQLKQIGLHLLSILRDRTAKGLDRNNKPFKPYSTNAFGMPYGAAQKAAVKELLKQDKAIIFTSKNNKRWVLIKSGYLDYKKFIFKGTSYDGTVNLMLTGRMLQDLNVLRLENNQIVIGFNNMDMAERAMYNVKRGRDFLGFSDVDFQDTRLKEMLAEGLEIG